MLLFVTLIIQLNRFSFYSESRTKEDVALFVHKFSTSLNQFEFLKHQEKLEYQMKDVQLEILRQPCNEYEYSKEYTQDSKKWKL